MIIVSFADFQLSCEPLGNQLLQLTFLEHVIVPVIHCRSLILITNRCLNQAATLAARFLRLFLLLHDLWRILCLLLTFFVFVLKVPCNENILSFKYLVLLFVGPDINKYTASHLKYTMKFANGRYS